MVADINSEGRGFSGLPSELTAMGGKLYFTANNGNDGYELWVYNPYNIVSSENPVMVADIWPGSDLGDIFPNSSYPNSLTELGGKLYFQANNGDNGLELWVYDPEDIVSNDVNPRMVADINSPGNSFPRHLTVMEVNFTSKHVLTKMDMNFGFMILKVPMDIYIKIQLVYQVIQEWLLILGREMIAVIPIFYRDGR